MGAKTTAAPKALPCCRRPWAEARSAWSPLSPISHFGNPAHSLRKKVS